MAASSIRKPSRCKAPAALAYHPTKGRRRVSLKRIAAQGRMPRMVSIWSKLGASVR